MKRGWLLVAGLASVLVIVGLAGCSPGTATLGELKAINIGSQQEGIWVNGEGKATAVPDIATLSLGIEAQEASVAEARTQAAGAMNKVVAALTNHGVAQKDIQTQGFNIQQVTRWDEKTSTEVVVGYRVTNMVVAKIRTLAVESFPLDYKAGTIIDAVAAAGGDLTRIDSIDFSVDDPSAYYEEARQEAMADAKDKAEQLAELAGVTLGKPTYISESSYFQSPTPVVRMAEMQAAAVETPISPGEMEISLSVQVVYALK